MRILTPAPLGPGDCVVGVRPRTFGAIVDAIGSPSFVNTVARFFNEHLAIASVHLDRWRAGHGSTSGYLVEWLGSWFIEPDADFHRLMDAYYQQYWHTDPLIEPVRGTAGTRTLLRHVRGLAAGDFRRRFFDEPQIAQECVLVQGTANVQYALSLTRSSNQAAFDTDELFHIRQMTDLLFPLIELHARTCSARRVAPATPLDTAIDEHFDARLAQRNIRLSQREREICRLLLSRRSASEAATHLDIKLSTAETYVKRAFAKLGVRTRGELFDWVRVDG